jgi:hypothetical protein
LFWVLVLSAGFFKHVGLVELLVCWSFLLNLLRDPFYVFYITHFVEFYGLEPSTCFGFLIPLVEYFIAVFFWRSWLSGPIISSVGAFDWACSKK